MKPNRKYTILGCTVEVTPGGRTAWAHKPGGETREFTSVPGGASADVQAQRWIHKADVEVPQVIPAEAATDDTEMDDE
jgi:hypothetical protein